MLMCEYQLRQVRVPIELYKAIKIHCVANNLLLKKFYNEIFTWFFSSKSNILQYLACYKKGKILSLWLTSDKVNKINQHALTANVSDARVVFTALIAYTKHYNIYKYPAN